jgi:hypothetical protein
VSLTTIAVAGPDRSGSGPGFPVPKRTILVLLAAAVWGCCPEAREAVRSIGTKTRNVDDLNRIALTRISSIPFYYETALDLHGLTPIPKGVAPDTRAEEKLGICQKNYHTY